MTPAEAEADADTIRAHVLDLILRCCPTGSPVRVTGVAIVIHTAEPIDDTTQAEGTGAAILSLDDLSDLPSGLQIRRLDALHTATLDRLQADANPSDTYVLGGQPE